MSCQNTEKLITDSTQELIETVGLDQEYSPGFLWATYKTNRKYFSICAGWGAISNWDDIKKDLKTICPDVVSLWVRYD